MRTALCQPNHARCHPDKLPTGQRHFDFHSVALRAATSSMTLRELHPDLSAASSALPSPLISIKQDDTGDKEKDASGPLVDFDKL